MSTREEVYAKIQSFLNCPATVMTPNLDFTPELKKVVDEYKNIIKNEGMAKLSGLKDEVSALKFKLDKISAERKEAYDKHVAQLDKELNETTGELYALETKFSRESSEVSFKVTEVGRAIYRAAMDLDYQKLEGKFGPPSPLDTLKSILA